MRSTGFVRRWRGWMVMIALLVVPLLPVAVLSTQTVFAEQHDTGPRTWQVTVGVQTSDGAISGMAFTPSAVYVKAGDTIVWTVGSKEIHTVAFGTPPADTDNEAAEGIPVPLLSIFEEQEERFATPAGGSSFDGAPTSYYNSGIMTTEPAASGFPGAIQHYALTINAPVGDYTFYCLVHGPMMSQIVHVIPSSQLYPFTQRQYDEQAQQQREQIFEQGRDAYERTAQGLAPNSVSVDSAVDSGQADLMRFIRSNTTIKVGSTVTFTNVSMGPHTVTIGSEQAMPGRGILPFGNWNDIHLGDNISSGLFGAAFSPFGLPSSVTFRFTQPGVYPYFCVLHDYEGMVGTITVTTNEPGD
jgi:plastocyanin